MRMSIDEFNRQVRKVNGKSSKKAVKSPVKKKAKKSYYIVGKRVCTVCCTTIEGAVIFIHNDKNPYGICCISKVAHLKLV